jgi:hypothetical protein
VAVDVREELVSQLVGMGFSTERAKAALRATVLCRLCRQFRAAITPRCNRSPFLQSNNVEQAVEWLFSQS